MISATESRKFLSFNLSDLQDKARQLRESVTGSLDLMRDVVTNACVIREQIIEPETLSKELGRALAPSVIESKEPHDKAIVRAALHSISAQLSTNIDAVDYLNKGNELEHDGNKVLELLSNCFEPVINLINQIKERLIGGGLTASVEIDLFQAQIESFQNGLGQLKDLLSKFVLDMKGFGTKIQEFIPSISELQNISSIVATGSLRLPFAGIETALAAKITDLQGNLSSLGQNKDLLQDFKDSAPALELCQEMLEQTARAVEQATRDLIDPALGAIKQLIGVFTGETFEVATISLTTEIAALPSELSVDKPDQLRFSMKGLTSPLIEPLRAQLQAGQYSGDATIYSIMQQVKAQSSAPNSLYQKASIAKVRKWFDQDDSTKTRQLTLQDLYSDEMRVRKVLGIKKSSLSPNSLYPALRAVLWEYYTQNCLTS